jgi:sugar transferase EpsL
MYRNLKEYFDRLFSIFFLFLSSPFWLVIISLYVISFSYPIFFMQMRSGFLGRPFSLIKFRTLRVEQNRPLRERKFFLGSILRYLSLDELPQLLNVFMGDMSLVGPRPLPEEYTSMMSQQQKERFLVKPGITGLAQVKGRHSIRWEHKFRYDVFYERHCSFLLDLDILKMTAYMLVFPKRDLSLKERSLKEEMSASSKGEGNEAIGKQTRV